jgi:hypothetical protein
MTQSRVMYYTPSESTPGISFAPDTIEHTRYEMWTVIEDGKAVIQSETTFGKIGREICQLSPWELKINHAALHVDPR